MHKHKCSSCGTVWEHSEESFGDDKAHTCPKRGCGVIQKLRFYGDEPAAYYRDRDIKRSIK